MHSARHRLVCGTSWGDSLYPVLTDVVNMHTCDRTCVYDDACLYVCFQWLILLEAMCTHNVHAGQLASAEWWRGPRGTLPPGGDPPPAPSPATLDAVLDAMFDPRGEAVDGKGAPGLFARTAPLDSLASRWWCFSHFRKFRKRMPSSDLRCRRCCFKTHVPLLRCGQVLLRGCVIIGKLGDSSPTCAALRTHSCQHGGPACSTNTCSSWITASPTLVRDVFMYKLRTPTYSLYTRIPPGTLKTA